MKPSELSQFPDSQLLDVRLADDFEEAHLTGARNNCVFEVAFGDRLDDCAPNKEQTTIVYGANRASQEAPAAAEKLARLGYTKVHLLEGGLSEAVAAGLPVTKGTPLEPAPDGPNGPTAVDLDLSHVQWTGRNLLNKHWGTVAISAGHLDFTQGELVGGEITLDLTQLACTDLAGTPVHDVLISHLHNDDFFDIEHHPHATLTITGITAPPNSTPGAPNLQVSADLTLRGQTHPISFDAVTGITPDGTAAAQATFSIDRTRWGILYGSARHFYRLAGHVVNDLIDFEVKIVTR